MAAAGPDAALRPQAPSGPAPLSSSQERLFLLDQLMPGSSAYNVPTLVRVGTNLDADLLAAALNTIVLRHEILRTGIRLHDGAPVQEVGPPAEVQLTVVDMRELPRDERQAQAEQALAELASRGFDLTGDVMLRAGLVHIDDGEDLLLVVFHHVASDHASGALLFAELDAIYTSLRDGTEPALPQLPIQYADFARSQREQLSGPYLQELLDYWRGQLAGAPERLQLPTDRPRPSTQSYAGRLCEFTLSAEETEPLRELARAQSASLFMVLLAGFQALVHRYTGALDLVIGTPVSGRQDEQIAPLLGFFSNTLALRTDVSDDPTVAQLLGRAKAGTLQARAHQDLPFERLVEELNPERSQSHTPIFQVLFGFDVAQTPPTLAGCELDQLPVPGWQWSRFDLSVVVREQTDGSLRAQLEYSSDLFDASTIERLIDHYRTLLAAAARDPEQRLSELPLLTPAERKQMLIEWNATARGYDRRALHEQFSDQAARRPDAIAVQDGHERISYGSLQRRSSQLARELRDLGVEPGGLVALCLDRSIDLLVAMLGVLQTGAAYVPIEPTYPPQRQELIVADAGASVLVTEERHLGLIDPRNTTVLCMDRDRPRLDAQPDLALELAVGPDSLAYVIYTSGSTGQPKGVEISHRSVANLLEQMRERPGIEQNDVLANLTTPAFDLSVPDWHLPLTSGARLAIVPREATLDGVELADWLARTSATIVQATPTTWQMLVDAGWKGSEQLKIVCGGEALPRGLAEQLLQRGHSLWHMYGPTETTVWSSILQLGTQAGEGPTPLGGPIANTSFYVMDTGRQPVPIGVPGELYIGGDGVARGYHGRAELTAERFVADPFALSGTGRLYRTGDLVRWRADATLEFLGRIDQQVKLRGFRIELEEIEAVLSAHASVAAAVAAVREDTPGDRRLVAYVVAAEGQAVEHEQLRRTLRGSLPPFMVPSIFVELTELPVTPNGKLDRAALPAPDGARPELERPYAEPEGPMQEALASIWREVLSIDKVGIDDDFFRLGGHSMLAVRMVARVRDTLGLELPLARVFERPTIRELAASVTRQMLGEVSESDLEDMLSELEEL
ncbi:MAG TPA: amino acid adenylation domain-containing protein [Solirubrobacteraceae bacterium]|jgi:amino acid adenylation domain-containing protein|nr:amino acid adenylation domain-containing protein [Solirubrobacteraceae bacterium]